MTNAKQTDGAADALVATLFSIETADGKAANVVDALFAIARAIESLAVYVKYLGVGDAATTMGAIAFTLGHFLLDRIRNDIGSVGNPLANRVRGALDLPGDDRKRSRCSRRRGGEDMPTFL